MILSGQMRLSVMSSWFLGTARKLSQSTESSWRHPAIISRQCLLVGSSVLLGYKQTVWDVGRAAKFTKLWSNVLFETDIRVRLLWCHFLVSTINICSCFHSPPCQLLSLPKYLNIKNSKYPSEQVRNIISKLRIFIHLLYIMWLLWCHFSVWFSHYFSCLHTHKHHK